MMQVITLVIEVVDIIVAGIALIMEQDGIVLIILLTMVQAIILPIGQGLIKPGAHLTDVLVILVLGTLNI